MLLCVIVGPGQSPRSFGIFRLILHKMVSSFKQIVHSGAGKGGKGAVAPNVEKDGPRNSSKFDEKIGEGVGIHLRYEKIINIKYF